MYFIRQTINAPSVTNNKEETNMINYTFGQKVPIDESKSFEQLMKDTLIWEELASEMYGYLSSLCAYNQFHGYKRMFRYVAKSEFKESLELREFLVDEMNILPEEGHSISGSMSYTKMQDILKYAMEWMADGVERLNYVLARACAEQMYIAVPLLSDMLKESNYWHTKFHRCYKDMENTGFNPVYIQQRSEYLHDKYKKKESENPCGK